MLAQRTLTFHAVRCGDTESERGQDTGGARFPYHRYLLNLAELYRITSAANINTEISGVQLMRKGACQPPALVYCRRVTRRNCVILPPAHFVTHVSAAPPAGRCSRR